ncbi:MAG: hypothetical protein U9P14_00795, partial [Gemmatimonadota bacterium]|nr:hypothetical protein [Gemmatimonadota bacterium]
RNQSAGYVDHSYNGHNPWHLAGNFFISVGPVLLGTVLIYLVLRFLAGFPLSLSRALSPAAGSLSAPAKACLSQFLLFAALFKSLAMDIARNIDFHDYKLYISFYLVLCIGSSMTLSTQDIRSGIKGLAMILVLVFLLNLVLAAVLGGAVRGFAPVLNWAAVTGFLMLLALAACWAGIGLIWPLRKILRR